jgi:hypothetical protein
MLTSSVLHVTLLSQSQDTLFSSTYSVLGEFLFDDRQQQPIKLSCIPIGSIELENYVLSVRHRFYSDRRLQLI